MWHHNLKAFIAVVNRQLNTEYKPNHNGAKKLFDNACVSERNFLKRFANDPHGSAALVRQVVTRLEPQLRLRDNSSNKSSSLKLVGSVPNGGRNNDNSKGDGK